MQSPRLLIILFLNALAATAQVSTFNHPGAHYGRTNPAFIVHTEARTIGLATRLQWPGTAFFSSASTLFYNPYFERIHSGLSFNLTYKRHDDTKLENKSASVRYAYKIIFLERFYWCIGAGLNYENEVIDVHNYHVKYEPKKSFPVMPSNRLGTENINADIGLLFLDPIGNQFIGVSYRRIPVYDLSNPVMPGQIINSEQLSVHGRGKYTVTRSSLLLLYLSYEYTGKTEKFMLKDSPRETVIPAFSTFAAGLSYFFDKNKLIGIGYKLFPGNYGSFNYNFVLAPKGTRMSIGYSFDTKVYIQYDKIHFNNSHEFFVKYRLPGEIY